MLTIPCSLSLSLRSALWHEVEALAEQGLVGIAVLNSKSFVVHHGAAHGTSDAMVYGTNPMAFAFPRPEGQPPLLWDQVREYRTAELLLVKKPSLPAPAAAALLLSLQLLLGEQLLTPSCYICICAVRQFMSPVVRAQSDV